MGTSHKSCSNNSNIYHLLHNLSDLFLLDVIDVAQDDCRNNDGAGNDRLYVIIDAEDVHSIGDDTHQQAAEECAADRTLAAVEGDTADNGSG